MIVVLDDSNHLLRHHKEECSLTDVFRLDMDVSCKLHLLAFLNVFIPLSSSSSPNA